MRMVGFNPRGLDMEEELNFYLQAHQIAIEYGWISVSLVQRKLRLGYGYALSIVQTLEHKGIVGPVEESGKRYTVTKNDEIRRQRMQSKKPSQLSKNELPDFAMDALYSILDMPGTILYSSHETIRPGRLYLMGLNPGGKSTPGSPTIHDGIESMLVNRENAFLDQAWGENANAKEGEAPLQKRIKWVIETLGEDLREVLSTNLVFSQTPNSKEIPAGQAKICWPVHEALLGIVQPSLILTYGNGANSPYSFVHSIYGGEQDYTPCGHGSWSIKRFKTVIDGRPTTVIGFPHFSYYHPQTKKGVEDWLKANRIGDEKPFD